MAARKLFIDMQDGGDGPRVGDHVAAIGVRGNVNSVYVVVESYRVKRKDSAAAPRYQMKVMRVTAAKAFVKPESGRWFEFRWYPRKKRKMRFEDFMRRSVDGKPVSK